MTGIVVDQLLCDHQPRGRRQRLTAAGISGIARMRTGRYLQPHLVASAEAMRGWPEIDGDACAATSGDRP